MPDRLNQVVSGEPSLGTPHWFPLNDTTARKVANSLAWPAAGAWYASAIDCSGYIPVGTKAVIISTVLLINATAAGNASVELCLSDNNSTTPTSATAHPYALVGVYSYAAGGNHYSSNELIVPVNSSRAFYAYCLSKSNVSGGNFSITLKGYVI